jgi:twinkle protein
MGWLLEEFARRHADRLGVWKRRGPDGIRVTCPAHDDSDPSLDVDERNGRLLFVCRAGCDDVFRVVKDQLRLKPEEVEIGARTTPWVKTAAHTYPGGSFRHVRRERYVSGRRERTMPWEVSSDGGATWATSTGGIGAEAGLYQGDLLAERPSEPVFIAEGEKCVDVLIAEGLVAVTNPGGASEKKLERYADAFRGRRVFVLPDNDDPGERHAEEWVKALRNVARSVWIVRLPGLGPKEDVADWFTRDGSSQELERLAEDCNPLASWVKPSPGAGVLGEALHVLEHGWPKGWPLGLGPGVDKLIHLFPSTLTVLTGVPSSGKSTMLDTVAVNLYRSSGVKTAFFSGENPEVSHVIGLAQKFHGASLESLRNKPNRRDLLGKVREFAIRIDPPGGSRTVDAIILGAEYAVERHGIGLVVIDPWSVIEKNREREMLETEFCGIALEKFRRLAQSADVAVVLVAHPKKILKEKDGNFEVPSLYEISGSAHFFNAADVGLVVHRVKNGERTSGQLLVRKVRHQHMGNLGEAEIRFDSMSTRFFGADQLREAQNA